MIKLKAKILRLNKKIEPTTCCVTKHMLTTEAQITKSQQKKRYIIKIQFQRNLDWPYKSQLQNKKYYQGERETLHND